MMQGEVQRPREDVLAGFFPFLELDEESRIVAAGEASLVHVEPDQRPIERGTDDEWAFYLLEGRVELEAEDGKKRILEAGSDKAIYPISTLRPHRFTVTTLEPTVLVQIVRTELDNLITACESRHEAVYMVDVVNAEAESLSNPLFNLIHQQLSEGVLAVPSLPEVAVKIRQLVRDDADMPTLVKTIQSDPAIAAKLIRAANSPIFRGRSEIETCTDAVVRLGLRTVNTLVLSFVMKDLFRARNQELRQQMLQLWEHSTSVASTCFILAQILREFEPEQALLAGLIHDIGVIPILETIDRHPDFAPSAAELEATITALRGDVGGMILEKWGFPDELVDVAREAHCWYRDPGEGADYCDLVLIAQLHNFVGSRRLQSCPPMYDLPAFSKMALGRLTAELSLQICNQAQEEIDRARRWLTS